MPTDNGEHLFFIYDMHGLQAEEEEEKEVAERKDWWQRGDDTRGTKTRLPVWLILGDAVKLLS